MDLDLAQLVLVIAVMVAAAGLYAGFRLIADAAAEGEDGPVFARGKSVFGLACILLAAALLSLVAMATVGPWRRRPPEIFPMRVPDLHTPPAPIDSGAPPPGAVTPATRR